MINQNQVEDIIVVADEVMRNRHLFHSIIIDTMNDLRYSYTEALNTEPDWNFWNTQHERLDYIYQAFVLVQKERDNPLKEEALQKLSHLQMVANLQLNLRKR